MRILTINNHFASGGAAALVVEYLRQLAKSEHEIEVCTIYTIGEMAQPLLDLGVKFYNFEQNPNISEGSSAGKYDPRLVLKLANVIRQGHYDVVHVHTFPSSLLTALASMITPPTRFVFTEHSVNNGRRGKPMMKILDRFIYSRYDAVVGVSQMVTDALVEWQPQLKDHAYTIVNAVDTARFQFDPATRARLRAELGAAPDEVVLFFGGRFHPVKALDRLIDAVARLCQQNSIPIKLLLAGSGELEADLRQQVREAGLEEVVVFLGFRGDIPELLMAADVVVLPSHWEGVPIILLEAMAARRPIVATRVGGVPEIVSDEVTGLLTEPDDVPALVEALARLVASPELRAQMGEAGFAAAKSRFAIDVYLEQLLEIYRRVRETHTP